MYFEVKAFSAGLVLVCWAFCPYCGHSLAGAAAAAGPARPAATRAAPATAVKILRARKVPPNFVPSMTTVSVRPPLERAWNEAEATVRRPGRTAAGPGRRAVRRT